MYIWYIYFGTLLGEYGEAVKKREDVKNGAMLCYSCIKKKKQTKCSMKHCIVSKSWKKEESDWNFVKLKGIKKKRRSI